MTLRRGTIAASSLLICLALAACGGSSKPSTTASTSTTSPSGTIDVSAAASLTSAFETLGKNYEKANPGTSVRFNFAGSSTLVTQITHGSPVDVFASADTTNMDKVKSEMNTPQTFATNSLIVILPKSNPGKIKNLKDLANPGIKIAVAEPSVPIGAYTNQVLEKMSASSAYGSSYGADVKKNFVTFETSVGGIISKVELGEVDAGYVYVTDAQDNRSKTISIDIPKQYNVVADYPIATATKASNSKGAQSFVTYVLSSAGQSTLASYGFGPASG